MKIGIVSQWFPPEGYNAPASLATELAARGHSIKVLTGYPNYPDGIIYEGYRQRWDHLERYGSAIVRRVPLYPSHDSHAVRRATNYLTFALSSSTRVGFLNDCDVVYVYATPMTAATAAVILNSIRKTPFLIHCQDLWPESVMESGMVKSTILREITLRSLDRSLRCVYDRAAHVIAIAPTMKTILHERGVAPHRLSVVYNWSPDEQMGPSLPDPSVRAKLGRPDRTIVVFAGNVGSVQDVETVVRAASKCTNDMIDVAIVGTGTHLESVRRLVVSEKASNVRIVDPVPESAMPAIYTASDYQLVTLQDRPVFRATIPSKLGRALAHGSRIITTVPGDVADMCERGRFGFTCSPENPEALADTLRRAAKLGGAARLRMADAARQFYTTTMSMNAAVNSIESLLQSAATSNSSTNLAATP